MASTDSDSDSGSDSDPPSRRREVNSGSLLMMFRSPEVELVQGSTTDGTYELTDPLRVSHNLACSSYATPVTAKKKVFRRTNAQIVADTAEKNAIKTASAEFSASKEAAKKKAEIPVETFTELKGKKHAVQISRSNWSVEEQICLIRCYREWEVMCEKSQDKKLIQISKMWLVEIPALMAKDFGRVRLTPSNSVGSSPYKSKWQDIRKKVSDFKAAQPDGREEELPDVEGPTGAGLDENGIEDERSEKAAEQERAIVAKRNERFLEKVDKESLAVIEFFIKTYPQSITGVGLISENDQITGAGRKRESCEISGFGDSTVASEVEDATVTKKVSKSSLILDLTRTAVAHHEESIAFQRMSFDYQKETRKEDIERSNDRDVREVDYRERLDIRDQERYDAEQARLTLEQARLVSAQNDTKDFNLILGGFLTSMIAKL